MRAREIGHGRASPAAPSRARIYLSDRATAAVCCGMFAVDERTAEAIRRAYEDGGELAGVVELRRHFPLIADNSHARLCVRRHCRLEAAAGSDPRHVRNWTARETGGSGAKVGHCVQSGRSRAARPRCLSATWRSARTAQSAAGSQPSRLACRTQQTIPDTGRPIAKNTRPGRKTVGTRPSRPDWAAAAREIGPGVTVMAARSRCERAGPGVPCHCRRQARPRFAARPEMTGPGPPSMPNSAVPCCERPQHRGRDAHDACGVSFRPSGLSPLSLAPA